jgi:hypothetical protein
MAKATEKKAPAFKYIEGAKAIDTAIKSIATRGKSLERDIHVAAVSCLMHADMHGDVTLAQKLVEAVPSLTRKNALRDWFQAHGKFGYDVQGKTLTFDKKGNTLLDAAIATPFWEFKQETAYNGFNIEAAVLQLVKRAEKAIEKGEKVPAAKLEALRKLA